MKLTIIILLVMIVLTVVYSKYSQNKLLKELYRLAYVDDDEEGFVLMLSSLEAQMLMSDISRKMIELNYWIAKDNFVEVKSATNILRNKKMNKDNTLSFYSLVIGYFADKHDSIAVDLLNELKIKIKDNSDLNTNMLINDCEMVVDIYINHNVNLIDDLEKIINSDIDNNAKSIYQYRLAILYKYNNEMDKCIMMLNEALNNTSNKNSKEKIESILKKGCSEL